MTKPWNHKILPKIERFTRLYFETGEKEKSAILAGYSVKCASVQAFRMLKRADVQALLEELREQATSHSVMTVLERKQRLSEIARAKLTDFMELGQDGSWVNLGKETKQGGAVAEIHSRTDFNEDGVTGTLHSTVKLHSPIQAIAELNKMEGVYPPVKTDITTDGKALPKTEVYQVVNLETKLLNLKLESEGRPVVEVNDSLPEEPLSIPESTDTPSAE